MLNQTLFSSVRESLATAQTVSIFLSSNPDLDKTAASLALFLSLGKGKKQVSIACPTEMTVEFSTLVGIDQIKTKLNGRDLIISFDYLEDSIEKVSYNIENNKFNLVVQPKVGFLPLSTDKVNYSYSGSGADLIFTVGVRDLKNLGKLYQESRFLFEKRPIIDIDVDSANNRFGKVNLIDLAASSCSEIVTFLISRLGLPVDEDIVSNLFWGIEKTSNGFSSPRVSAATFEAAAFCLRAGARRITSRPRRKKRISLKPMPAQISAAKKPKEPITVEEIADKRKPSPDWFEPKIYKGDTRV